MPSTGHFSHCRYCQSPLEADGRAAGMPATAAALQPFGHYQLQREAGHGGMGVVYQAYDEMLQRQVALKVLHGQQHGFSAQQQLLEEARAASSLQHPNIVTVYDISRTEQQSYIVTEWLDGQTLDRYQQRPLSLADKLEILQQTAAGLACAHQAGVIHRDLKPSNLMICLPGQRVKILDFGMASRQRRLQHVASSEGAGLPPMLSSQLNTQWSQHTTAHQIKGTLPYLAPELLQSNVDATAQSDMFAFGVIMYELCYGVHPFLRDSAEQTMQAILQHQLRQPEPAVQLPAALRKLISQCLATQSAQRPPQMSMVDHTLQSLHQELQRKEQLGIWYPLLRWQLWAALAPLLLGLSLWIGQQSIDKNHLLSQGQTLALLPFANIGGDPSVQDFLRGMTLSLSQDLARLGQHNGNVWVLPPAELSALQAPTATKIYQTYQTELVISGTLQHLGTTRRLALDLQNGADGRLLKSLELDLALDNWDLAQQQVRAGLLNLLDWQQPAGIPVSKGAATDDMAYKQYLTGLSYLYRFDYKDNIEKSVQQLQRAAQAAPTFIEARFALAEAYLRMARLRDLHLWLPQADQLMAQLEQSERVSHSQQPRLLALQAESAKLRSDFPAAITLYQQALQSEPANAMLLHGIARAYEAAGDLSAAEQYYQQAIAAQRSWYFINALAVFYYEQQQLDKAEQTYRQLIGLSPNNAQVLQTLGAIQFSRGDYPTALQTFQQAVAIDDSAVNQSNIGTILFYQRDYASAAQHFARATELKPNSYQLWGNLADSYRWAKLPEQANQSYQQAISLVQKQLEKMPHSAAARLRLGVYLAKSGQARQALLQLEHSGPLTKPQMLINAAQICEISGQRQRAAAYLQQALRQGYSYQAIVDEPEFAELIQQRVLPEPVKSTG